MKKKELKKENNNKEYFIYIGMFILLFLVHFPLLTKNILTADVLLNNNYYNGYSWEISLGRFGLFIMGLLKSYLSIPHFELIISFILIIGITYLLINLFDIKDKVGKVFSILIMSLSPIISSTLLFHYCSVPYFIAFFSSVLSLYLYYKTTNKYTKYLLPIILMVLSLSMYQAYLSVIITVFFLYQIKLLINKEIDYKESGKYLLGVLISIIIYFIGMKLSQIVFHIDMASYSNANKIGIDTILSIPSKFVSSYKFFFQMFYSNEFTKNSYLGNSIFYSFIFVLFIYLFFKKMNKSKLELKEKIITIVLLLLIPVFLHSVIFVISDAKTQLLMSASYLVLFIFMISFVDKKVSKIIFFTFLALLCRCYFIQDQATYLTLENTYKTYDTVIHSAIDNHMNQLDKSFIVVGNMQNKSDISKMNYGYISDEGLFWDEYNLRKLGFERFCLQEYGLNVKFGSLEDYNDADKSNHTSLVYEYKGNIVVNFNNYYK